MLLWELTADCNKDVMLLLGGDIIPGEYFRHHFNGEPIGKDWIAPKVDVVYPYKRLRDFLSWSFSAPVVSERARNCLSPLISPYCEFLDLLAIKGRTYYAINVLSIIDCMDMQNSDVRYVDKEQKIIRRIVRFKFIEDRVPSSIPILKVKQANKVFVNQDFVDCVVTNKLGGASFNDPSEDNVILSALHGSTNIVEGLPK
jgi:hypothetical protein